MDSKKLRNICDWYNLIITKENKKGIWFTHATAKGEYFHTYKDLEQLYNAIPEDANFDVQEVIIGIDGGVGYLISKPDNIIVKIRDYDNGEVADPKEWNVQIDNTGKYVEQEYEAEE